MTEKKSILQTLTERRHPDYVSMLPHWEFMEATYVGGRDWFLNNIFQYMKEGPTEYADRLERAYRFNHTREVVDLVNKYLFRGSVVRNEHDASDALNGFWKKATLQGLDMTEFMKIVSTKSSIGGRPWVIVDNATGVIPENASQADTEKSNVYAYVVAPKDVLDMSYDSRGVLNWILIREYSRDDNDPLMDSGIVEERFRLWTRQDWILVGETGPADSRRFEILDQGIHALGEVPAVKVDNAITDDPWSCPALITDVAYLDRATANYASNLDAIIQDQTFSQLAMPAQNVLPGDDAYNAILDMGTKRIFLYDGEGGQAPQYLSPDPKQAALIITAIQQLINEIYHTVGLAGERTKEDNSSGIDNSSGVAKAFDFERVTALLAQKADSLETAENKIARLVSLWAGEDTPEEDLITYSETFEMRGLQQELAIALQLSAINVPEYMRSEQMKGVAEHLFPKLSADQKKEMIEAIEKWEARLEETSAAELQNSKESSAIVEESKRNRSNAGDKQSATKSRDTD